MKPREERRALTVVGAPTSAGSYAAGQESAPRVLREYGLLGRLRGGGREVLDAGDGPLQVWRPDREHPFAQNFDAAAEAIRVVDQMVARALEDDHDVLVLGGNCTIAVGAISALVRHDPASALVYIDRHFDLNTPTSTRDGALDWMGMSCALGELGVELDLGLSRSPLLEPAQLHYLGIGWANTTPWERQQVERLGISWGSSDELAQHPELEIAKALERVGDRSFAVHLDVDVLDFIDLPLAEETNGRNSGPTLDAVSTAISAVAASAVGNFRVLSIGELNPTRAAGTPDAIPRFIEALGAALQ